MPEPAYAQAVSEHSDFCRNGAGMATFPLGRVIDIPNPDDPSEFYYTKLVTWISPPRDAAHLEGRVECKPKGNYAVVLHQGGTSTVARSYEKLLAYVEREGFRMRGPLYELDMNSYLMSASADDYLLHISVLVDVEDAAERGGGE